VKVKKIMKAAYTHGKMVKIRKLSTFKFGEIFCMGERILKDRLKINGAEKTAK